MSARRFYPRHAKEGIPPGFYCGKEGGANPQSFPVNTPKRAIAALSYSRYAPNPEGIKICARRVAKEHGWLDETTGRIRKYPPGKRYGPKTKKRAPKRK